MALRWQALFTWRVSVNCCLKTVVKTLDLDAPLSEKTFWIRAWLSRLVWAVPYRKARKPSSRWLISKSKFNVNITLIYFVDSGPPCPNIELTSDNKHYKHKLAAKTAKMMHGEKHTSARFHLLFLSLCRHIIWQKSKFVLLKNYLSTRRLRK